MEKLHFGWLTKSPPEYKTQRLFPAKWRRRYFVLYVPPFSVTLPGKACNAILDYYSNEKMVKKRGSIDLEKCHSIISNFDSPCHKHIFIMKTVHREKERDYYLASDSKEEIDEWVNILCDVVGLNKNSFSYLTPTKLPSISCPTTVDNLSKMNTVPKQGKAHSPKEDYFALEDCFVGRYNNDGKIEAAISSINDVDRIQIYQLPAIFERKKITSNGSSNRTDSNDFPGFTSVDDVYNIPRNNQPFEDEYKMPKMWQNSRTCDSESFGLDEGLAKENLRSPSSSSTSSTAFNDYDVPPPKAHVLTSHVVYANTSPNPALKPRLHSQTSPHEVPLPLKIKTNRHYKKDSISRNGSSSSSDAHKRLKQQHYASSDGSCTSSSSSDNDVIENGGNMSGADELPLDGVYNLPRRTSELGRDALVSVFEENDFEKYLAEHPASDSLKVQKVQYLHLDFPSDGKGGEVESPKPAPGNKVEYKEIDFEKTRALSEVRVTREIKKSQ